eukprot:scaffold394_cov161-Chaetoceros_neogracile.AAC.2
MSRFLPSKLRDFLIIQKRFTAQPGFSNALGLSPHQFLQNNLGLAITRSTEGVPQYRYQYVIPDYACVKSLGGKDNEFSTSAILAIFDEFTTLAIVNEDPNARPGVSMNLSTNLSPRGMKQLPKAGDALDIFVKFIKIGKTFAFTEVEAQCSETGMVIATGKHTKFLNSGSIIQKVILGQTMLPIASHVASMLQQNDPTETDTISMREILRLDTSKDSADAEMLILRKELLNPMGSCHGGAIAMAMEQFARKKINGSHKGQSLQNKTLINLNHLQWLTLMFVEIMEERLPMVFCTIFLAMISIETDHLNSVFNAEK